MEKVKNAFEIYSKFLVDINLEFINNNNFNNNIKIIKEIMLILQEQKEFLYKLIYKYKENENLNNIINNYSIFLKDNILSILNSNSINNKFNEKIQHFTLTNNNDSKVSINKQKYNYNNNEIGSISLHQSENEIILNSFEKSNLITNKDNKNYSISNSNYTLKNQIKYESPKTKNKNSFLNEFSNSNNSINNSFISSLNNTLNDINKVSYFEEDEEEPIYFRDQVFKRVLEKINKNKFEKKVEQKDKISFCIKNKKNEFSLSKTKLNNKNKKIKYESDKKIFNNNKLKTIKKLNRNKNDKNIINKIKTYQKDKSKLKYSNKNIKDFKNKLFDSKKLN